jgi:hypothetical protein
MFWTEAIIQRGLFGADEFHVSSCIARLIKFAEEEFPDCDSNFHRMLAFLTHNETQNFLRPMLLRQFGTIDAAKMPTIEWLESLGSFETFARSTRSGSGAEGPSGLTYKKRRVPDWYASYVESDRFLVMKCQAKEFWHAYTCEMLHCSVNARHPVECWHHSDYGRLGEGDEFRFLIPLCNDCHASVSARGPRIPAAIPEAVKQWI